MRELAWTRIIAPSATTVARFVTSGSWPRRAIAIIERPKWVVILAAVLGISGSCFFRSRIAVGTRASPEELPRLLHYGFWHRNRTRTVGRTALEPRYTFPLGSVLKETKKPWAESATSNLSESLVFQNWGGTPRRSRDGLGPLVGLDPLAAGVPKIESFARRFSKLTRKPVGGQFR